MTSPRHIFEIYIKTTPERLWQAFTDPELTKRYFYGSAVESSFRPGASYRFVNRNKELDMDGTVVEAEPLRRLVTLVRFMWDEDAKREQPSRISWEIERVGDACKLTVVHDDVAQSPKTFEISATGMSPVLSALKIVLETGTALEIPSIGLVEARS